MLNQSLVQQTNSLNSQITALQTSQQQQQYQIQQQQQQQQQQQFQMQQQLFSSVILNNPHLSTNSQPHSQSQVIQRNKFEDDDELDHMKKKFNRTKK